MYRRCQEGHHEEEDQARAQHRKERLLRVYLGSEEGKVEQQPGSFGVDLRSEEHNYFVIDRIYHG
jgi:hypothetical protein